MRLGLISLLILLICIQLSLVEGLRFKKLRKLGAKRFTAVKHLWKGKGNHQKKLKDYGKASNPEMMVMLRMKKMLSPLRNLFIKVLDLGPRETFEGRPAFCGDSECPSFNVLNKSAHYELRQYEASSWVSISTNAPSLDSKIQSSLFWPLFNYIQGSNRQGKKIQMTVPVTNVVQPDPLTDGYNFTMSFFISPSITNIPMPNSDEITIQHKPSFKVYVHSFKGYAWSQDMWTKHADMLAKFLNKDGLQGKYKPVDEMVITAGYDDPLKMFNRHNEVWLLARD